MECKIGDLVYVDVDGEKFEAVVIGFDGLDILVDMSFARVSSERVSPSAD